MHVSCCECVDCCTPLWLNDVYGKAINEVLAENPDREFCLSLNGGKPANADEIFTDLSCPIYYTAQYASTHMYASSTPHIADATLNAGNDDDMFWLAFRNEDSFDMRFGDPDFMKDFIGGMPVDNKVLGFVTGSDGYVYGREYSSTDPEFKGEMYIKKHWFNYFLIGRLAFEPNLSDERIQDVFYAHYGNLPETELLLETTSEAGKIIPQVNKIYYQTNGDYTWFVAGNWSHPSTFGYIDLKKWMKADNTYQDGTTMSVEEYALALAAGTFQEDGRQTPISVAENLIKYAEDVLANVAQLKQSIGSPKTYDQKNMLKLVIDNEAMAYLGLFYSERVLGSVDIRLYNETTDEAYKASSIAHLEESAKYFDKYAEIISSNYVPQQLSRVGGFNVLDIAQSVHKDVQISETWKPRKITSSYKAPSKEEYMGSSDEQ